MEQQVTVAKEAAGVETLSTYTQYLDNLKYGTFTLEHFTASNGVKIDYYLYIPDYGTTVEGLPVFMYMHGGGQQTGVGMNSCQGSGLTKALANKTVTPSGIVICPHIRDFDKDYTFVALKGLCDEVVTTQKADPDRVSVGGHSWGAITAYNLVNKYPGYFSACVPISGSNKVTDAFKDTRVWAIHGTKDLNSTSRTYYYKAVDAVDQINAEGGDATLTSLKGKGHGIAVEVMEGKYTSPDGKEESPFEWAFRQKRKKSTATA
jgi:predicted peptidase